MKSAGRTNQYQVGLLKSTEAQRINTWTPASLLMWTVVLVWCFVWCRLRHFMTLHITSSHPSHHLSPSVLHLSSSRFTSFPFPPSPPRPRRDRRGPRCGEGPLCSLHGAAKLSDPLPSHQSGESERASRDEAREEHREGGGDGWAGREMAVPWPWGE